LVAPSGWWAVWLQFIIRPRLSLFYLFLSGDWGCMI